MLANAGRRNNLATVRQLLAPLAGNASAHCDGAVAHPEQAGVPPTFVCRNCGKPMLIVRLLEPAPAIRAPPQRIPA